MRSSKVIRILLVLMFVAFTVEQSRAFSLALDSIATWGKFPNFCIKTYRWGDRFFNGYDTAYVVGTGYKFNVKSRANSMINAYRFYLPDNVRMNMISEPSTSVGLWLTYLAVSGGYDKNISRLFGNPDTKAREEFQFGFNCSLFAFNMAFVNNTGGINIKRFTVPGSKPIKPDIEFNGLKSKYFGFDLYYFFNHKKYSQAAAFNFSRIQIASQGSWFAGFTYYNQEFDFDFNALPTYITDHLPETWPDHKYNANTKNYGIKFGYGYNWVFRPNWLLAVSESPTIGIKRGIINNPDKKTTKVNLSNLLRVSVVWNHREWFAGAMGTIDTAIIYDRVSSFQNSVISGSISVGYRFNIW